MKPAYMEAVFFGNDKCRTILICWDHYQWFWLGVMKVVDHHIWRAPKLGKATTRNDHPLCPSSCIGLMAVGKKTGTSWISGVIHQVFLGFAAELPCFSAMKGGKIFPHFLNPGNWPT